jgi:hypothetical protein
LTFLIAVEFQRACERRSKQPSDSSLADEQIQEARTLCEHNGWTTRGIGIESVSVTDFLSFDEEPEPTPCVGYPR